MNIRRVTLHDTLPLIELFSTLDSETQFMLFEPDERALNPERMKHFIESTTASNSSTFFIAEDNEKLVGFIHGQGYPYQRNKHSMTTGIAVLQSYWGKGLGKKLLHQLETWARAYDFHRIELTVMAHNQRAVELYKRHGFIEEGIKKDALYVNKQYVDEICMAKIITGKT